MRRRWRERNGRRKREGGGGEKEREEREGVGFYLSCEISVFVSHCIQGDAEYFVVGSPITRKGKGGNGHHENGCLSTEHLVCSR